MPPVRPPIHTTAAAAASRRARTRDYNKNRSKFNKSFYKSARWRRVRELVLAEEPLCRECKVEGRVTPATEVDHIKPISAGGDPFARDNLQALCKRCHSRKTRKEMNERADSREINEAKVCVSA